MLSVLIPVYNQTVIPLVQQLVRQGEALNVDFEVRCLDDGSTWELRKTNRELYQMDHVHYKELAANVGRSRIRNLLAEQAQYPYLLFLDGDSKIIDSKFLASYLDKIPTDAVWVGGRKYGPRPKETEMQLHWRTGRYREQKSQHAFQSNNFLIPRHIMLEVRFREQLHGYGHEDTLLGYDLEQAGIGIHYLDNPIQHAGVEPAQEYLAKQEEAIRNLNQLRQLVPDIETRLLHSWQKLKVRGLVPVTLGLFRCVKPFLRKNLMGPNPKLIVLDFYKLGYLIEVIEQESGTKGYKKGG